MGKSDTIQRRLLAAKAEERAGERRIYAKGMNEYAQAAKKPDRQGNQPENFASIWEKEP